MTSTEPYGIAFSPPAARAFKKLPSEPRNRIRKALLKLAADASTAGRIRGKTVRTIQGTADSFHRLRVGEHRVMFDVLGEERIILVLGIVHRSELERWLRNR